MRKVFGGAALAAAFIVLWVSPVMAGGNGERKSAPNPAPPPAPSAPTPGSAVPQNSLFSGDGGRGKSIAILAPQAAGLGKSQDYLPALVQGELVSVFSGYSAIAVLDRASLEEQYTELVSGYYDDHAAEGADLGHLSPTDYILGGTITRTAAGYALQMRITRTADNLGGGLWGLVTRRVFPRNVPDHFKTRRCPRRNFAGNVKCNTYPVVSRNFNRLSIYHKENMA